MKHSLIALLLYSVVCSAASYYLGYHIGYQDGQAEGIEQTLEGF